MNYCVLDRRTSSLKFALFDLEKCIKFRIISLKVKSGAFIVILSFTFSVLLSIEILDLENLYASSWIPKAVLVEC